MAVAPLSFDVATTLASQRVVVISAAHTVAFPAAASDLPIGITVDDVSDTTAAIPVAGAGQIAKLFFNDTVAAAGLVGGDTSGRGIPIADIATTTGFTVLAGYVGILVGPAVALTATIAEVYIQPGFVR